MKWFKNRLSKDLEVIKKSSKKHDDLEKKLFDEHHIKKKKKRVRYDIKSLLLKAGLNIHPQDLRKQLLLYSFYVCLFISFGVILSGIYFRKTITDLLIFLAGFWAVGYVAVVLLLALLFALYVDIKIYRRRKQVEEVLPDFLQLTASNIGAGMPIDRALWLAVRPRFGVLAEEIEAAAKRVITGDELDDALIEFANKYDSPMLTRSINLLLEGVRAGGQIADLLHKIATDIQDQRILRKELSANVLTYVIFIGFAAVVATPVLLGLSTELMNVIKSIASNLGDTSSSSSSVINLNPDVILEKDFKIFSYITMTLTSTFAALIISVIRRGNTIEAFTYIPFFVGVSYFLYWITTSLLSKVLGVFF